MVLDEDVNGFKNKRGQNKKSGGGGKKSKKVDGTPVIRRGFVLILPDRKMRLLLLSGIRPRITTLPDQMTTMNSKCGDSVKGRSAGSVHWKKGRWVSTNATGVAVSLIVREVVPKVNDHTKQVRGSAECDRHVI